MIVFIRKPLYMLAHMRRFLIVGGCYVWGGYSLQKQIHKASATSEVDTIYDIFVKKER